MAYRIFIVEDHPRMRETYQLFIEAEPNLELCGTASNGAEALAEIPHKQPDLVIVDISLPDTNGFDLVRSLHEQDPSLLILVVSGHPASHFADRLAETGIQGYIDKSTAHKTLIPMIMNILDTAKE
jgi:YesN/AraC family two-component response regulator